MHFDVVGLTNALIDMTYQVSDEDLSRIGLRKGFSNQESDVDMQRLQMVLGWRTKKISQSGSPANVMFDLAKMADMGNMKISTALFGTLGDDHYGEVYEGALRNAGIECLMEKAQGTTGICHILVTPDKERTSVVCMGVAGKYDFNLKAISRSDVFHISGYEVFTNPKKSIETIEYACSPTLHNYLSFDLRIPACIAANKAEIQHLIRKTQLLFMTEAESRELTGQEPMVALGNMSGICETVILKKGKYGSIVRQGNQMFEIPAYPIKIVNTNGAGDAYAAGFIYSHLSGLGLEESGHVASRIASLVCKIEDSHL